MDENGCLDRKVRWGILGTGSIAHSFATGLSHSEGSELLAVGSRKTETADAFAKEFGIPRAFGSYDELVGDADVDVIYIASPHSMHKDNSILCLEAGKAVLCEKPFAINATEAEAIVSVARVRFACPRFCTCRAGVVLATCSALCFSVTGVICVSVILFSYYRLFKQLG